MNETPRYQQAVDKLRRERDELRVQLHLAKAELRDELGEAYRRIRSRLRRAG